MALAWSFKSAGAVSTGFNTTVTPAAPATYAVGDLLIVVASEYAGSDAPPAPASWTRVTLNSVDKACAAWMKVATGSNGSDTMPGITYGNQFVAVACLAYSCGQALAGLPTVDATAVEKGTNSTSGLPLPSFAVPTQDGCLVINVSMRDNGSATSVAVGTVGSFVKRITQTPNNTNRPVMVVQDWIQTTATAFTQTTQTTSPSDSANMTSQSQSFILRLPTIAAPTFTVNPANTAVTATSASFSATTDVSGTLYGVCVASGAAAPSAAQIIAGQNAGGTAALGAANTALTGGSAASLTISGLTSGTRDFYFVATNAGGNSLVKSVIGVSLAAVLSIAVNSANTDGFTLGYTSTATGTVYIVAMAKGSAAPTAAQVRTGSPTGFVARVSKACTATVADTQSLTALTAPVYDLYAQVNNGADGTVSSFASQQKLPAVGRQYVKLTSVSDTSPLTGLSPAIAAGDIVDTAATATGYAVTVSVAGDFQLDAGGDETRELIAVNVYDDSVGAMYWSADSTLAANDLAPVSNSDPGRAFTYFLARSASGTVDLSGLFTDPENDVVTFSEVTAVLAGLGCSLGSTHNATLSYTTSSTDSITAVTLRGSDPYGGTTDIAGTIVVGKVTTPDCALLTEASAVNVLIGSYLAEGTPIIAQSAQAAGTVISQNPAAGALVDPNTAVVLTISAGQVGADVVPVIFLNDATPVPASALFRIGRALDRVSGATYVCLWPTNGFVFYLAGIAHRYDGAMIIAVGAQGTQLQNGLRVTARGEVCAVVDNPDVVVAGMPLQSDGTLCVSATS